MPLNKEALPLPNDPQSVRRAREWISDLLSKLGRPDLVDAAELGVSELVTNAILHADPPITVRLRGTKAHPRVEVRDHSHSPPEVNIEMTDEDQLLSTIGRGLGIVALYSSTWGSELASDGKTVWFEPSPEIRTDGDLAGSVFDIDELVDERLAAAPPPGRLVTITLLDMPVHLFAHFRKRYSELQRELRLLALAHDSDYPIARQITELFLQAEQERRQAKGVSRLDEAIEGGVDRVDLEYEAPESVGETMARLADAMERADEFCREQRLLTLAASPQQLTLQRWYLGEFVRQARGEPPRPWTGGFELDEQPYPLG